VQELTATIVNFSYINVSQGSVAMQLRCGRIFNNRVIANFPQRKNFENRSVFGEDVDIWTKVR